MLRRCGKGVEIPLECRLVFGQQGLLIHPLHMGATGRPHRLLDSTNSAKNHPIGLVEQQDYGVPKWKCKDCLRQTSFKPPRGEPLWKKETAVLLYTLSMNAIAKHLGVSTPSILNWILRQRTRRALNRIRARAWL